MNKRAAGTKSGKMYRGASDGDGQPTGELQSAPPKPQAK